MEIKSTASGGCSKHSGFILLATLAALVILMLLYFIDVRGIFHPDTSKAYKEPELKPWELAEKCIKPSGVSIDLPLGPKPVIEDRYVYRCEVMRNGQKRGTAEIVIKPDGRVEGKWQCSYSNQQTVYSYNAEFAGNIDRTITFKDTNGSEDESKLFIIAEGRCTKTCSADTSAQKGAIYLTGWVGSDYSLTGKLTITTDKSWEAEYNLQKSFPVNFLSAEYRANANHH